MIQTLMSQMNTSNPIYYKDDKDENRDNSFWYPFLAKYTKQALEDSSRSLIVHIQHLLAILHDDNNERG